MKTSQNYILENFRLSKESIIKNIDLILTDRIGQKNQIITKISRPEIKTLDDIIGAIENFILENNRTFFWFFSTSRLQRQLSILVDGLKIVKQKQESITAEKNYQRYLQHDKRLDEIIKTILLYSPSRQDVETLKLIGKYFEKLVKKLKTFIHEDENQHPETEIKERDSERSMNAKLDKLLQPIKESGEEIKNAFLQLMQLRFYQFISGGLLNLNAKDRDECYFEDINDTKKYFHPIIFEFKSEREETLKELFYMPEFKESVSRSPDDQSKLNATLMFVELLKQGNEKSVHFDWLKEKIVLLTNTDANVEDLMRTAESQIASSSKYFSTVSI